MTTPIDGDLSDGDIPMPDADSRACFRPRVALQATGISDNHDPQLSADGKELFFARDSSGTWDLWRATRTRRERCN